MSDDPLPGGPEAPGRRPIHPLPVGSLSDLAELLSGESASSRRFLGGLVVGALVGAAVAGSTVLRRRRREEPRGDRAGR
jgi:hypothetical protein